MVETWQQHTGDDILPEGSIGLTHLMMVWLWRTTYAGLINFKICQVMMRICAVLKSRIIIQ